MALIRRFGLWLVTLCLIGIAIVGAASSDPVVDRIGHCYEKLAIWEMYNIAFEYEGKEQTYIGCQYKRGGKCYDGEGKDGRLTFQQFMNLSGARTDGKGLCTVEEPNPPSRSFKTVAEELQKQKFDGILNIRSLNPKFGMGNGSGKIKTQNKPKPGRKGKKPSSNDIPSPDEFRKMDYPIYLEWIEEMVDQAAAKPDVRPRIDAHLNNIRELSTRVESIRQLELDQQILADSKKSTSAGGFGLTDEQVVENAKRTSPYSNVEYGSLDWEATMKKIGDRTERRRLKAWVEDYGREGWNAEKDTQVRRVGITHIQSLTCWTNMKVTVQKYVGTGCSD